jgi:predicted amidophosphoribosyltransferase
VLGALQRTGAARVLHTDMGLLCPSCRAPVQRRDQFCIHCGVQLVEAVPRCAACHAYVHQTDRFCIFCGSDLRVKTV